MTPDTALTKALLRPLATHEYSSVCAWAMAEQWPGLSKGSVLGSEEFADILDLPGHRSFAMTADADTAVVGFGQIWQSPNGRTHLIRLIVDPALRGRGYGKRLCALLLAEAAAHSAVREIYLRVRRDNLPALAVYRSLGFRALEAESHPHVLTMVHAASAPGTSAVPSHRRHGA